MNFFNKLAAGIEQTAQISKLELIVERRLAQYDREVGEFLSNIKKAYSTDELLQYDDLIINRCLTEYDSEAVPYMGRQVNADWMEGGGDNLEIRKRMLHRSLQSRRGSLQVAVERLRANDQNQLNSLIVLINQTENTAKVSFPTDNNAINQLYAELRVELGRIITATYPGGLEQFDLLVNGTVTMKIGESQQRVMTENEQFRNRLIQDFRRKAINNMHDTFTRLINETGYSLKANLRSEIPDNDKVLTVEVVDGIRKEMDEVIHRYLSQLRNQ